MPKGSKDWFAQRLLAWFAEHGRHDLPWQQPRTRYRVWLSEIMLQQTQVSTVIDYFQRFVADLPDLASLAEASEDQVLALWSGLGYYSRARNLHAAAKQCMQQHAGELPGELDALIALPGIGRSTAAAILAQADNQPHAILDGNVKRVLARFYAVEGWTGKPKVERELWAYAEQHTPTSDCVDYTQAIMDLGATLCRRSMPACQRCPVAERCQARAEGRTEELPHRKPKKTRPERQRQLLLIRSNDAYLLQRRPGVGLWGGLYCPPIAETLDELAASLPGLSLEQAKRQIELDFQHDFSHFRLQAQVWQVDVPSGQAVQDSEHRWLNEHQALQTGLPAPIRSLFKRLLET
jgi:A/G-specific adenine glycosylase